MDDDDMVAGALARILDQELDAAGDVNTFEARGVWGRRMTPPSRSDTHSEAEGVNSSRSAPIDRVGSPSTSGSS